MTEVLHKLLEERGSLMKAYEDCASDVLCGDVVVKASFSEDGVDQGVNEERERSR